MATRKKSPLKQLQKKAENLWKEYCKKRDKKCVLCGSTSILQVHHIFSRKNTSIFIDISNGVTLCRDCHCNVTWNDSAKETLRRKIDPEMYERLYEQSLNKAPFLSWKSIDYLEQQIRILEELIRENF